MTPQFARIWQRIDAAISREESFNRVFAIQNQMRRRRRRSNAYGSIILWTTIAVIALWIFMAVRPAAAQGLYIGRDGRAHPQIIAGPDGSAWPVIPTYCQHGWGPCPVALAPPIPPFAPPVPTVPLAPPPPLAYAPAGPPPVPAPLGWVYAPYTSCANPPGCSTGMVTVAAADGLNVRAVPAGFGVVVAALANGTPLIPLGKDGDWILIAPACQIVPTYTYSVTAGGVPLSVCS